MDGEVIVQNLLPHLQAWWPAIRIIGILIGFVLILIGIYGLVSGGRQQQGDTKSFLTSVIAGILLINIMAFLNVLAQSFFAAESETGLSYTAPGGDDPTALYITFAIYIVMLVGMTGLIYGCILLKRSANDGSLVGRAITHMFGGMMAVNIVQLLHLLSVSMGPGVDSAVSALIGG